MTWNPKKPFGSFLTDLGGSLNFSLCFFKKYYYLKFVSQCGFYISQLFFPLHFFFHHHRILASCKATEKFFFLFFKQITNYIQVLRVQWEQVRCTEVTSWFWLSQMTQLECVITGITQSDEKQTENKSQPERKHVLDTLLVINDAIS